MLYLNNCFAFRVDFWQDVIMRKMIAHRVDIIDVKAETPVSNKQKPAASIARPATTRSSSGASGTNEVQHFSKRRVNLVRLNGGQKYRLIAPSTEYRDRFLDVMFMMSRPSNPVKIWVVFSMLLEIRKFMNLWYDLFKYHSLSSTILSRSSVFFLAKTYYSGESVMAVTVFPFNNKTFVAKTNFCSSQTISHSWNVDYVITIMEYNL